MTGSDLKWFRSELFGMTQVRFAELLGVDQCLLGEWEDGKTPIPRMVLLVVSVFRLWRMEDVQHGVWKADGSTLFPDNVNDETSEAMFSRQDLDRFLETEARAAGGPERQASALKRRRQDLGLNQEQLANELRVAQSTVSRWELGRTPIPRIAELALSWVETGRVTRKEPADES